MPTCWKTWARLAIQCAIRPPVRKQLTSLLAKTDGNDRLAEKLQEIIGNTELQQKIGKETGAGSAAEGSGKEGA